MESTTISGPSGSTPKCTTSRPLRPLRSSTALMLEEPTSRPTIAFDPNPNMCPPLHLSGGFGSHLRFLLASYLHLGGLLFHPLVQPRLLEAPAVSQFEGGDLLFPNVLVKRVRTHSQVLRRLANIHDFTRVGHSFVPLSTDLKPVYGLSCVPTSRIGRENSSNKMLTSEFRCAEHISTGNFPRPSGFVGFYACFLESNQNGVADSIYRLYLLIV